MDSLKMCVYDYFCKAKKRNGNNHFKLVIANALLFSILFNPVAEGLINDSL